MPIPTFEEVMLPLLKAIRNKNDHSMKDVIKTISDDLNLTDEERNRLLPSGKTTYMQSRVGWAKTYMKFAGLVEQTERGLVNITEAGLNVLNENPSKIDRQYLSKFPEFVEWQTKSEQSQKEIEPTQITNQTPEDMIALGYKIVQEVLYSDLLEKIKSISAQGFELLILELCKKMNYGNWVKHTGKTGDHGIDGIIKEDRLGLGEIYLQAKKWENQVTSKEIRDFAGSLQATKTKKGIFITTSDFSPDGKNWIKNLNDTTIILINGKQLSELMIEFDVGVSTVDEIKIKRIDQDYFEQFL